MSETYEMEKLTDKDKKKVKAENHLHTNMLSK